MNRPPVAGRAACRRAGFAGVAGIAFLLLGIAGASAAENLDRLFFTPLERQTLDEAREQPPPPPSRPSPGKRQAAPVVDVISFDGKVERSDGMSTLWVNGQAVYTGDRTVEGIRIEPSRGTAGETSFELPPSDSGSDAGQQAPRFKLKVGEKVAVQNGRKFEAYETRPSEDSESVFRDQEDAGTPADARGEPSPAPAAAAPRPAQND